MVVMLLEPGAKTKKTCYPPMNAIKRDSRQGEMRKSSLGTAISQIDFFCDARVIRCIFECGYQCMSAGKGRPGA